MKQTILWWQRYSSNFSNFIQNLYRTTESPKTFTGGYENWIGFEEMPKYIQSVKEEKNSPQSQKRQKPTGECETTVKKNWYKRYPKVKNNSTLMYKNIILISDRHLSRLKNVTSFTSSFVSQFQMDGVSLFLSHFLGTNRRESLLPIYWVSG